MKLAALLIALALLFGARDASAQTLRIYHIDVEQGDSTLFVTPSGRTLLVDSGNNGHGPRIESVMKTAGVNQIDAFVATHYHSDHYGGIDDLVNAGISVLESYDRGDKECCLSAKKKKEPTFIDYQTAVGEDAIHLTRGMTINLDPEVAITCISSGGVVVGETNPTPGQDENDMSISLLITFRGFRYFVGGDIEAATEAKIAAADLVTNLDVYQANHHGSHSSSSQPFMNDLLPTVIVISNGNRVDYAHPRQVTLNTYAALQPPPTVFQTNKYLAGGPLGGGNVPDAFIADPETTDDDGTILLTVNGAASTFTVSYGSTTRTFSVKAPASTPTPITAAVVIESLLPNPAGDDEELEEVVLRNRGTTAISLVGWILRDRSGLTWTLAGTVNPGQSRTFVRSGQDMSLNNAGDEIALIDVAQVERDRFEYQSSTEGTVIKTLH